MGNTNVCPREWRADVFDGTLPHLRLSQNTYRRGRMAARNSREVVD